jgi:hypothetical protein
LQDPHLHYKSELPLDFKQNAAVTLQPDAMVYRLTLAFGSQQHFV